MTSLEFETEDMRPVAAQCRDGRVWVTLKDGRGVSAPLTWYPFLHGSTEAQLNAMDLEYEGIWWNHVDEGVSVKSMFLGWKAPGGVDPQESQAA
ncbi:MAG: DUF2442 domain-containing protein [Pseudomonadota bacterium]